MVDILDSLLDAKDYVVGLEWIDDIKDFFSSMFENIGEFSVKGVIFGILSAGLIFLLRKQMLLPFLKFYKPTGRIIWEVLTYIACFIAGYLLGKHFDNS